MPNPLTPARLAEIRRRHDAATEGPWRDGDGNFLPHAPDDIRDLLAEVERIGPAESFRCHHCGGEFREAPAMTMVALSDDPSTPPDPLCHDCALKAVDGSRVRELEAEVQRLRDPWRVTAVEKPEAGEWVYVCDEDEMVDRAFVDGPNWENYNWHGARPLDAFPWWMPMGEMPKPKGKP